jgi:protein-S-isoprenylcysteine O-methyltransferase
MYHIANSLALAEYLLVSYFRPSFKSFPYISSFGKLYEFALGWSRYGCLLSAGVVTVLIGQFLRSAAMIKAASNFSHAVAFRKNPGHHLVTGGVYASVTFAPTFNTSLTGAFRWSRHPSYTGFFYWALGTQLVLQNPLSFCVYYVLLIRFFSSRIRGEPCPVLSVVESAQYHRSGRTCFSQFLWR